MYYCWTGDVTFSLQINITSFRKFSPFLALGILVLYQAGFLQAAPFRSFLANHLDSASITEKKFCLLLATMVRDYAQKKIDELEEETRRFSIATQKRACNTATCVTNNLEGKLEKHGGVSKNDLMLPGEGRTFTGHRRRNL